MAARVIHPWCLKFHEAEPHALHPNDDCPEWHYRELEGRRGEQCADDESD